MKKMDDIDRIILDIDKVKDEDLGKYKKVLTNKIKVRLNMFKLFFNNYNKVCKTVFELTLDSAEGNAEYAILSLKYFG